MAVSRRKFLKAGTMVSLSAVIPMNSVESVLAQSSGTSPEGVFKVPNGNEADERLTEELFSRYLNTKFLIYTSPLTAIKLELVNVKHWEPSVQATTEKVTKSPELDSFSVLFRGPRATALESKTYRISHPQMGDFDLFISPVNDRKKERLYQAVFTRFKS